MSVNQKSDTITGLFNLEEFRGWPIFQVLKYFRSKGWRDCKPSDGFRYILTNVGLVTTLFIAVEDYEVSDNTVWKIR